MERVHDEAFGPSPDNMKTFEKHRGHDRPRHSGTRTYGSPRMLGHCADGYAQVEWHPKIQDKKDGSSVRKRCIEDPKDDATGKRIPEGTSRNETPFWEGAEAPNYVANTAGIRATGQWRNGTLASEAERAWAESAWPFSMTEETIGAHGEKIQPTEGLMSYKSK